MRRRRFIQGIAAYAAWPLAVRTWQPALRNWNGIEVGTLRVTAAI